MNNKTVCFRCDELLFDIEIECDEEKPVIDTTKASKKGAVVIALAPTTAKKIQEEE